MNSFNEFQLPESVQRALAAMQFVTPTPVQAQAIPVALEGKDVVGSAQTGSGKTAAFCLPMLSRFLAEPNKTGLVLVPTRELALQIDTFWKQLTRQIPGMYSAVVIGGASMVPQIRALQRRPRLIIATPGRLVDHLQRRTVRLQEVAVLVLDEADRMLDMGFAPQLTQILKYLPTQRQTLFFTATWEKELDQLAKRYLTNPVRISVGTISQAAPEISQELILTNHQRKNEALLDELNKRSGSVLVFVRTKSRTDRVARYLESYGVSTNRLHGGRSQAQRTSALKAFRNGGVRVLCATDIAARGIDVADVGHVVNYDLPMVPDDYIHRIGRTGRAGATGQAVSLLTPEERGLWRDIVRLLERTGSQVPAMKGEFPKGASPTAQANGQVKAQEKEGLHAKIHARARQQRRPEPKREERRSEPRPMQRSEELLEKKAEQTRVQANKPQVHASAHQHDQRPVRPWQRDDRGPRRDDRGPRRDDRGPRKDDRGERRGQWGERRDTRGGQAGGKSRDWHKGPKQRGWVNPPRA
ncbi:MAG TPA: DEAD/DEAH box helicase [Bdellovibrionota bacterium]|jgi:superfamily II DNA/RNA helicase|nr:DEAD/DEAH box helicase [Bdellovibrionota bacterium]